MWFVITVGIRPFPRCVIRHVRPAAYFRPRPNVSTERRLFGSGNRPTGDAPLTTGTPTSDVDHSAATDDPGLTLPRDGSPLRCTEDQWLYLPTKNEVNLFRNSTLLPHKPIDVEGSVIVRLVDLKEGVTSPVGHAVHYSEYGVRRGECLRFLLLGSFLFSVLCSLGYWQLRRRDWKVKLLNARQAALSQPIMKLDSFANLREAVNATDDTETSAEYRCVECTGVLDTSCALLVGPRPPLYESYGGSSGYCVVHPLRFRDGSCVLVNLGWLDTDALLAGVGSPEFVTLRGVLVGGEIYDSLMASFKLQLVRGYHYILKTLSGRTLPPAESSVNRPRRLLPNTSRNVYRYLDPSSLSTEVYSSSPTSTGTYLLNAYDVLYHDDVPTTPGGASTSDHGPSTSAERPRFEPKTRAGREATSARPPFQRRQKSDYLLFYADPDTHTNYAYQWFLMAASVAGMCVYKLLRVRRTLRALI
ncbi:SURFEIT locus domain containing protein, putative [Babesia caballi]|uniref:SURF1-like protein n=1 Tax=Babesia caballi TaxID=5871 RepID=A0AAV4LZJ8_BABCB|nr:SURFEIT locus domain containg protein, putative [Babesia caballi]